MYMYLVGGKGYQYDLASLVGTYPRYLFSISRLPVGTYLPYLSTVHRSLRTSTSSTFHSQINKLKAPLLKKIHRGLKVPCAVGVQPPKYKAEFGAALTSFVAAPVNTSEVEAPPTGASL